MAESPSGFRLSLVENRTGKLEDEMKDLVPRLVREHEQNSGKLDAILAQTTKTNGTVKEHTSDLTKLNAWKDRMMGAWFALTTLAVVAAWFLGKYGPK